MKEDYLQIRRKLLSLIPISLISSTFTTKSILAKSLGSLKGVLPHGQYYKTIDTCNNLFCNKFYDELEKLYLNASDTSSSRNLEVKTIADIGLEVAISSISSTDYPTLKKFADSEFAKGHLAENSIRFLETNSNSNHINSYKPHVDRVGHNQQLMAASLTFPMINCNQKTTTSWYRNPGPLMRKFTKRDKIAEVLVGNDENLPEVCNTILRNRQTIIIRTERYHSVRNTSGEKRVIASWYFKPDLSWEDIGKIRFNFS